MHKAVEIGLGALAEAIVPTIGAVYVTGGLANRVEQLERRAASLEQRPALTQPAADPLKAQCAKLAELYTLPKADRFALKEAMDALACFRAGG